MYINGRASYFFEKTISIEQHILANAFDIFITATFSQQTMVFLHKGDCVHCTDWKRNHQQERTVARPLTLHSYTTSYFSFPQNVIFYYEH